MSNIRKFNDKDVVFVNSTWNIAEKCEITGFVERESSTGKPMYIVHSLDNQGSFGATEDCIFDTRENAIAAHKTAFKLKVKAYCKQIKTLDDLVRFPIHNCINGDEYTDYPALEAYKIRAKELANVDISFGK